MHPLFVSLIMSYLYTASHGDTHLFRSQKYLFKDIIERTNVLHFNYVFNTCFLFYLKRRVILCQYI